VHGLSRAKVTDEEFRAALQNTEDVVRRSMARISTDLKLREIFDGKGREPYLEGLVYGRG
jgi:hypothetical protein